MADPQLEEKKKVALKFFGKEESIETKTEDQLAAEKKLAEEQSAIELKKKEDEESAAEEELKKKTQPEVKIEKVLPTDDELLEMASKRAGRKITSWDELKPTPSEEEKNKKSEERDADKLSFGLKKGLFNKKQYESFISDSKDAKELVYSRELADAKKEDADWDEAKEKEFKEEFEEKFGINLDNTSSQYKRGQKQILKLADAILKTDYSSIYSLESEYGKYENEVTTRKTQEQKILEAAPKYKEDVDSVVASLSKIEMTFGEDKIEVPLPEESLKSLKDLLLDNIFSSSQILKGYKKEELQEAARTYAISQNYNYLSFEAAKKYHEKHEKGVRGIPTGGKLEKIEDNEGLTEQQKQAIKFFKIDEKPLVAN